MCVFTHRVYPTHELAPGGNVDEYLSKGSWVMDPYVSSLEHVEYLGCEDELAALQADSVSKKYFQK